MISKLVANAAAALADVPDGATVMIGGFGTAGQPMELIDALLEQGAKDLVIINNNAGNGTAGLAALLGANRVRKIICSFPRQVDSQIFDGLYRSGKIELELVPQGNLAERIRAAGAGIGAFFTPTGYGAAGRGQGNPRNQRPPVRAGIPAARRLRADQGRARRPLGQPGVPQDRAQLRPHHGQRGARGRGAGARDRRTGRARSRERGHPGIFVQRVVRIDAAPAAKEQQ